jgi:ADP-ribose pyrophosphatase YjhB (NUDIX family)
MNKSAGIIILNKSKVLLCRSSNSILSSTYSFQKEVLKKEKKIDAAIRELFEETSVVVTKSK